MRRNKNDPVRGRILIEIEAPEYFDPGGVIYKTPLGVFIFMDSKPINIVLLRSMS